MTEQDFIFAAACFTVSVVVFSVIFALIDANKLEKRRKDFIKNIRIGNKYISYIQLTNKDPFVTSYHNIYVTVLDVRFNMEDEIWVKVKWSDGHESTMRADELYYQFKEYKY